MRLDWRTACTLYRAELRMALRDRRTLFFSIVLPLLVMPVMLFASHLMRQKRTAELAAMTHSLAIVGPEAETARGWILSAAARAEQGATCFEIKEATETGAKAALARDDLSLFVVAEASDVQKTEHSSNAGTDITAARAVRLTVVYRGDRDTSQNAARTLHRRLIGMRQDVRARLLQERKFPLDARAVGRVIEVDVAAEGQVTGLALGRVLTLFLLLFVFMGGAVVATDSLAGEKERGTLETLLATAARRSEIIAAKSLLTITSAVAITAIQAINFLLYVVIEIIPIPGNLAAAVTPATAAWLFVLYLPLIVLVSIVLLATSGWARSYKEAQLYFMPVMLIGLAPALAPLLPGIRLRSAVVLVPVANIAVAVKEILVGAPDWPLIGAAWLVTAAAAAVLARFATNMMRTERLIVTTHVSREEIVGGPELFPRRVLRAFAIMWVLAFVVSSHVAESVRLQISWNIGVVFIGGSLFLIRLYRLDLRTALALRPVRAPVWLGIMLAVPGGLLTTIGLFRVMNVFLPAPKGWMEAFNQQLLMADAPLWQALILLTIVPGVGEEIAFRGVLLHGLRKRLHPAALALVVGVAFGFFHATLPRLVPTAFLGVIFAAVTLLTGSIFPAMAWHALNNGLSVAAESAAFPMEALEWTFHLLGVVLLALAFWIFWRCRTPYPELRPWRNRAQRS
ncbi:MAG: CPBP family intramembrane metalloprotease [Vicinamibacteria bacterium]|nr:CPBP family intramembrane metalloprotease [Vicinamibacteria bacterium]